MELKSLDFHGTYMYAYRVRTEYERSLRLVYCSIQSGYKTFAETQIGQVSMKNYMQSARKWPTFAPKTIHNA